MLLLKLSTMRQNPQVRASVSSLDCSCRVDGADVAEVMVVDGGSADGTVAEAKKHNAKVCAVPVYLGGC